MYEHGVKDEFLRELGHIAVSFSLLEEILRFLVIALINEPQRVGVVITSELSFKQLKALAVSLAKEKLGDGKELESLKKLMGRIGAMEEERNRIFHSVWWTSDEKPEVIIRSKDTAKEKHGLRFAFQDYAAPQLRAVGNQMLTIAGEIQEYQDSLVEAGKVVDPYEK